jgi:hypothetical protein
MPAAGVHYAAMAAMVCGNGLVSVVSAKARHGARSAHLCGQHGTEAKGDNEQRCCTTAVEKRHGIPPQVAASPHRPSVAPAAHALRR